MPAIRLVVGATIQIYVSRKWWFRPVHNASVEMRDYGCANEERERELHDIFYMWNDALVTAEEQTENAKRWRWWRCDKFRTDRKLQFVQRQKQAKKYVLWQHESRCFADYSRVKCEECAIKANIFAVDACALVDSKLFRLFISTWAATEWPKPSLCVQELGTTFFLHIRYSQASNLFDANFNSNIIR